MTARKPTTRKTPAKTTPTKAATNKPTPRKTTRPTRRRTSTKDATAAAPPAQTPPVPTGGSVEAATRNDLEKLGVTDMGLSQSAILMARHADRAETSAAAAQAARELRMTMTNIRAMTWPTLKANDDVVDDATVVPRSRLEAARRKAARRGRS